MERFRKTMMATALATGVAAGAVWANSALAEEKPIRHDPSYTAAVSVLTKEEARIDAAAKKKADEESARYNAPVKPEITCVDLDRVCYKDKNGETTIDFTNSDYRLTVAGLREILNEKQGMELDRMLAMVMSGKGKELIDRYGPVSESVEGLNIGGDKSWDSNLTHYMDEGQVKGLRELLISLDSQNAEMIAAKYSGKVAEDKKKEEERKKQEQRNEAGKMGAILLAAIVGMIATMAEVESKFRHTIYDVTRSANRTVLLGSAAGGVVGLFTIGFFSGMGYGFLAGAVIASAATLISAPFFWGDEKKRGED